MQLWNHQLQARDEALTHPKRALLWCPRLGKSLAAVECIKAWGEKRGVIVAPLVVCPMWEKLLADNGLAFTNAYSGPLTARRARVKARGDSIAIVNADAVSGLYEALSVRNGFLVVDEAHQYKSPSAKRAKAVRRLAWSTKYVRMLTGTPVPNHMGDLWGIMTCVDPEQWSKTHGKFANRHLIRHPLYASTIIGYLDLPRLERLTREGSHTVRREDVFCADEYQFIRRVLSLPATAAALYKQLAKEWVLDSPKMSAEHVLKRLVRLQQLTSGYLPLDDGTTREIHTVKVDAVMADLDAIVEAGEKVILFCKFRWEIARYEAEITKRFPGCPVHIIAGGVSSDDRTSAIACIANDSGSAVVIAQTQAGGIGISFAEAKHVMFVSNGYSFVSRKQAQDRVYSPGLRRVVYDYIMFGTIDISIMKAIAGKQDIHTALRNSNLTSLAFGL